MAPSDGIARRWRGISLPSVVAVLAVVVLLGWTTARAVGQMPAFDGAMNLQVSWSLAHGEGYRRTYADRELFPREVQSNVPLTVPAALVYRAFGMGLWQSQLVNLLYLYALLALGFTLVAKRFGLLAGACAALMLLLTPGVVSLGLRGLGEIPALAWIFAALCLMPWRNGQRWSPGALVLAGACLGLALATKTVIAICIVAVGLCIVPAILADGRERWPHRLGLCMCLAAGFALPLLAIEVWRMASLGGASGWQAWWLQQWASIDAQTGLQSAPSSPDAYLAKGLTHLEALGRFYGLRPWITLAWLGIPCLLAGLAIAANGMQRRHLPLLSLLLASALYFGWWLLVTPDNKVWHRRILDGSLMLNLAWVYATAWLLQAPGTRWGRAVGAFAAILAAALLAVFAYAKSIPAIISAATPKDYLDAVALIRGLPEDARIYGLGWNSAPQISLLAARAFGDFNDQTPDTLDRSRPAYIVLDTPGINARDHAVALSTYPSEPLLKGAKRTQVYRLDLSRLIPEERDDADAAQTFVALTGTAYPAMGGFGAARPQGRWMSAEGFVRLRYDGSSDLVLDLYAPKAEAYRRGEPVAISLELDGCALGRHALAPGTRQQLRLTIPSRCRPLPDALATLRIGSSDVLDQYIGHGGGARSIALRQVGFAPSCDQEPCSLPTPRSHVVEALHASPRGMLQARTPSFACAPNHGLAFRIDWDATSRGPGRVQLLLRTANGSTKTWAGSQSARGSKRTGPWMRPGMAIVLTNAEGTVLDQLDYPLPACGSDGISPDPVRR